MKLMKVAALIVAVLALGIGASAGQDYYGGFDGTWEGKLKQLVSYPDPKQVSQVDLLERRLIISGDSVRVYSRQDGKWLESKPGAYRIFTHKTNAVIFATNSDAGWVETHNYTITHKGRDDLYVYFVRSVNNFELPADHKNENGMDGRTFQARFGEMVRAATPAGGR